MYMYSKCSSFNSKPNFKHLAEEATLDEPVNHYTSHAKQQYLFYWLT